MADLSRQILKKRFSWTIETRPYLYDHCFEGKAIFPAVEALITMAHAVKSHHPLAQLQILAGARFSRTLEILPAHKQQQAQIEIESSPSGISAALLTVINLKNSTVKRNLEHARVNFVQEDLSPQPPISRELAAKLFGDCLSVPAAVIYRELIPFEFSYQNIIGDLLVAQDGAWANIYGGGGDADESLLGSPFVLDAALHAACVWGQRFADIVSFPVGFDRRIIHQATRIGACYFARIKPVAVGREPLIFDAWIFDQNGVMCESVSGLQMRDISQGRLRPPRWIKEGAWKKSY